MVSNDGLVATEASTGIRLGVVDGDGIGREIVPAARRVVDEVLAVVHGPRVEWVSATMGHAAIDQHGEPLPESTMQALDDVDGWLMGPHDSASYPPEVRTGPPPGGAIRKRFDLFANVRPARAFTGVQSIAPDMDLVIVRENSEGLYADRNMFAGAGEFMPTPDVAMSVGVVTRAATERIAHHAFRLAQTRRKHVTIVHKANVLSMTTGLFLDVCRDVAASYPDVTIDDEHVDAMAAHLVRRGADFDVVVAENLFGDILSDLAGELSGSLGTAASLNCSESQAMAQAAHGAAPTIAGRNRANPTAMILSAAMLLHWLSERHTDPLLAQAGKRIEHAVAATFEAGIATADLGGLVSTSEFTENVIARVHRR
ncbi:isocitrate/isopropylmalate dehydrogenase family protein [Antrihabitans cavernicola]|uniref:Isocitrate/isopropylmalate dehydrogenase family protein n=1 Tax=Antrihabitans cavernicola TaxID=2495913 RepID=A0A5A7S7F6_9NOCA|nr:isocitrate/isopropylmalate family dehydrogenase [Spelaeibacter cavernicola]KAA0021072.1 isocitrate/isopropylmalate dehydrogenase family protein [Spelaeibacter cavernicola]